VSCIARGSDSLFAEQLLEAGGRLVVVLPSSDYRQAKVKPDHAPLFDRLIEAADEVVVMPHETANRAAYESANRAVLERADRLVAVWNGQPPGPKGGGTADVVVEARAAGIPVDVVWPGGQSASHSARPHRPRGINGSGTRCQCHDPGRVPKYSALPS
jgi:hypothetical protein